MTKTQSIIAIAKEIAEKTPNFNKRKDAGKGDKATQAFMTKLHRRVNDLPGIECERRFEKEIKSAFDFYIKDEKTVIEIALSLRNPLSEFHKDIFKALLAKDNGIKINHLVFVSKQGAIKRQKEPQYQAIKKWLKKYYGIKITCVELTK